MVTSVPVVQEAAVSAAQPTCEVHAVGAGSFKGYVTCEPPVKRGQTAKA